MKWDNLYKALSRVSDTCWVLGILSINDVWLIRDWAVSRHFPCLRTHDLWWCFRASRLPLGPTWWPCGDQSPWVVLGGVLCTPPLPLGLRSGLATASFFILLIQGLDLPHLLRGRGPALFTVKRGSLCTSPKREQALTSMFSLLTDWGIGQ